MNNINFDAGTMENLDLLPLTWSMATPGVSFDTITTDGFTVVEASISNNKFRL
jgi:hypothetical protein